MFVSRNVTSKYYESAINRLQISFQCERIVWSANASIPKVIFKTRTQHHVGRLQACIACVY